MFSVETELTYGSKHRSQVLGAKFVVFCVRVHVRVHVHVRVRVHSYIHAGTHKLDKEGFQKCITIDFICCVYILEIIHI